MSIPTYTNSGLSTARRCLTEYDLKYNQRLTSNAEDSEALQVGSAWHAAFDDAHKADNLEAGFESLRIHAPSRLWNEKLGRLFAAYHWYWKEQEFEIIKSEHTFSVDFGGTPFEGQLDGIIGTSGRRGILERKTTSSGVDDDSMYWDRLRLDVQVGIYAMAAGFVPSFILYDVVRKPTINPKRLTKADVTRLTAELAKNGEATYFAEKFNAEQLNVPLADAKESIEMYGARLTADIGNRPEYYFARKEVARSKADFDSLLANIGAQVTLIEHAQENGIMHRNPDACATFGQCAFFGLCANNIRPVEGGPIPDGFHRREHRHPELAPTPTRHIETP